MSSNTQYNLSMVFERTHDWHFSEITLTRRMLGILAMINGERPLAEIYESLNLTYDALFSDLQHLHDLHLIKFASPATPKSEPPRTPPKMKKGYYRGAAFETAIVDTHQEEAAPRPITRKKQGCYRGASFDVAMHD